MQKVMGPAALLLILLQAGDPEVRAAVKWAVDHLQRADGDLVLYALLGEDTRVEALRKASLARTPVTTSAAAMRARALQPLGDVDAVRFCAQFLADNQAADGLWGEGAPIDPVPPPPRRKGVIDFAGCVIPAPRYPVKARREGPATGDAANTAAAVEGLMACRLAGAEFDPALLERAAAGWTAVERDPVATVTVLTILRGLQGRESREDPDVKKAVRTLETSPAPTAPRALYERLQAHLLHDGVLLGGLPWHRRGREILVERQQPDGSWGDLESTCYALLFLRDGAAAPMKRRTSK